MRISCSSCRADLLHVVSMLAPALIVIGLAATADGQGPAGVASGQPTVAAVQTPGTVAADAEAALDRGNASMRKKQLDQAIAEFSEAIRLQPDYALAYSNRGVAKSRQGRYDAAIADYNQALRLIPNYALAYCNRGFAWYWKGQYDLAIADFNQAVRINPKYYHAYNGRGLSWMGKQMYDAAIDDFNEVLRLKPDYTLAAGNRSKAYAKRGGGATVQSAVVNAPRPQTASAAQVPHLRRHSRRKPGWPRPRTSPAFCRKATRG